MMRKINRKFTGWLGNRLYFMGMLSMIMASLMGQPIEESVGLKAYPPRPVELPSPFRARKKKSRNKSGTKKDRRMFFKAGWEYLRMTLIQMLIQTVFLWMMWDLSGHILPVWILTTPCLKWFLSWMSAVCPMVGNQPELRYTRWAIERLRWASFMILTVASILQGQWFDQDIFVETGPYSAVYTAFTGSMVVLKAPINEENEGSRSFVEVEEGKGDYRVHLQEEFNFTVNKEDTFWLRMVILFIRQLEGPTERKGSRATRNGKRPLISQQKLATCFGVTQPEISRWEKWRLKRDWANLLSLRSADLLTAELKNRIVDVMALFPWWGQRQVYEHLREQDVNVTHAQVRQAAQESGWSRLKETLCRFFIISPDCIRPRDEGLVHEFSELTKILLSKLEAGERLTPEVRMEVDQLQKICADADLIPPPEPPAVPWARKMKWILFAAGATIDSDGKILCIYCGSEDTGITSRKSRPKRYQDEKGQWRTVEVYRYYCKNLNCKYGSFTNMPKGLLPYSPYPFQMHLQALEMYAWSRSSYRRTAQALGVRTSQVYKWVSVFGRELLPVAAMFGVLRCSGVLGIDEKWVQVPEKAPRGSGKSELHRSRRWMYVYLAIDVYTYDLLHIAIYKHNTADSTRAFLLALRAKGYKPRVIVTDLRKEYGPAIKEVFPCARHHECIFHALQWFHKQIKEVYGKKYLVQCPEAVTLKEKIDVIFKSKTRRTAEKRYAQVMALKSRYESQKPGVECIFASLERHWPTLVNGIESKIIPRTNNAVERIIGRFDQHYQNFRGFDSIETARLYLAVFEKVYRFTPFTEDAQPRIRGKCPLELAGYDISELPMTQICRGWALDWPVDYAEEVVPR